MRVLTTDHISPLDFLALLPSLHGTQGQASSRQHAWGYEATPNCGWQEVNSTYEWQICDTTSFSMNAV
jgi:hypothetical protein